MGELGIRAGNGVELLGEPNCFFDPVTVGVSGAYCISHAHEDHLPRSLEGRKVLCSEATLRYASSKLGSELEIGGSDGIEMRGAGHVTGSTMFLSTGERRVLYTGDFCPRDRLGIEGARPVKADALIIEATYGKAGYVFPPTAELMGVIRDWVEDSLSQGSSVALLAYPLGKSQELISLLGDLGPYLHGAVLNATRIAKGPASLTSCLPYSREAVREPFLLVCPMSARNSSLIRYWRKRGIRTAAVSGWAVDSSYRYRMGVDEAFPLSDHADFEELLSFVKGCDPSIVFTNHGFVKELAVEIRRRLGITAEPLIRNQRSLLEF